MLHNQISILGFVALSAVAFGPAANAAITLGQTDTFEDGTFQSWSAGANNPNGPTNIASGGPGGANDNYLRLRSDGSGPGGRLVTFNSTQWAGDYLAAGVTAITMQVNNTGFNDLVLRLILVATNGGRLTTFDPVDLPASSGWTQVSFSLASSNLSGDSYEGVMKNVRELNFLHAPDIVRSRADTPFVRAELGLDNIAAVPEPGTAALTVLGLLALFGGGVVARRRPARIRPRS